MLRFNTKTVNDIIKNTKNDNDPMSDQFPTHVTQENPHKPSGRQDILEMEIILPRKEKRVKVFEFQKHIKEEINKHKGIIKIKPFKTIYLNFHAEAIYLPDYLKAISDSSTFFDPNYHHLRTSFVQDFITEMICHNPKLILSE